MMQLKRIDHVALTCRNSSASRDWYVKTLGMEWVHQGQWDNNPYFLRVGDAYLALFQAGEDQSPPPEHGLRLAHFALLAETADAFQSARDVLDSAGIACDFDDHGVSQSIYFKDPDGHQLEITTYDVPGRD